MMAHPDACTGCASCAIICPDSCITVYRQNSNRHGRERDKTDERQRGDRPCGDSLRLRRLFRLPDHAPVGGDGDPDGTQTVGDDGHGRLAGRERNLVDQHGLRRCGHRQAGDDLVVVARHLAHGRRAELYRGRRTAVPDRQLSARRPRSGYDPALAGRLFPGLQGRRPRRLPVDRAGARVGAGDARFRGAGLRLGFQVP